MTTHSNVVSWIDPETGKEHQVKTESELNKLWISVNNNGFLITHQFQ